ncbi:D12 class N6 adenine-specific DNA methyltransferase [Pseudopedobacter saltans DSM 12145]|uniref:D12 class N6 adenine-specific DNA methyltransferase n=1 Tax=Pseudopedobacter saltans (strain ATCC 51119 / DSM 12145 / JCM 21818 / CCUG 39354 / LMG 10337 / NBRC 100064 / NCIMB 13643) TaxID=762903 RepID=F0SAD1_PSESL|nr:DNA adenine methylase [Pseudopedobacter saltans]ADY51508.1 D12 class N6 adenine-specific DNA methyltransferase [Pseudopedobacter saltans DSM 12145]
MKDLKTPISYYGGKQNLVSTIIPLFPKHQTYIEPFVGGGAIFWAKRPSEVEVINDYNRELINFYEVAQNEFVELEKMVRISLHSRSLHNDATVIYNNPHMFTRIQRAWAVWVLSSQSFSAMLDGTWGYDKVKGTTSQKITNKREGFTVDYAIRLQNVQIENTDALRVIRSRDYKEAFHYCDPPYFNSDCGHYDGYSIEDFETLLKTLESIEGKFLMSSYPSDILKAYSLKNGWKTIKIEQTVSVANGTGGAGKRKIEVLTANYDLSNPSGVLTLFN